MSTHHIRATREAFLVHREACEQCRDHVSSFCEIGAACLDEYAQAIEIHHSCEHVIAMDTNEATK